MQTIELPKGVYMRTNPNTGEVTYQAQVRVRGAKTQSKSYGTVEEASDFIASLRPGLVLEARLGKVAPSEGEVVAEIDDRTPQQKYLETKLIDVIKEFTVTDEHATEPRYCSQTDAEVARTSALVFPGDTIGMLNLGWTREFIARMRSKNSNANRPYAYATILKHTGLANRACAWLAERMDVPAQKIPLDPRKHFPKKWKKKRERRLAAKEERTIREALAKVGPRFKDAERWTLLFDLALETAARCQELVLAEDHEFDLPKGLWTIPAEHVKTGEGRWKRLTPKAIAAIARLMALMPKGETRLFHGMSPKGVSAKWRSMMKRWGIVGLRFHDLRHEAITRMVLARPSENVAFIMKQVGHGSGEMLMLYSNIQEDDLYLNPEPISAPNSAQPAFA